MVEYKKKEKCLFCNVHYDYNQERKIICENEKHVVITNKSPISKASSLIITKVHRNLIFELTSEEWNSMLTIIQDTISRINKVYQPIGYLLYICAGDETKEHFHLHIIPKYKKNYGPCWSKEKNELFYNREEQYQKSVEKLEAKNGIITENEKMIAKLFPKDEARCQAHVIIKPKKSIPNDIQAIDQETWNQMGELILTTIHQMKEKFNWGKELVALRVRIPLGKMTGIEETTYSELQAHIITRFSDVWSIASRDENEGSRIKQKKSLPKMGKIKENERIAEKLRNPDKHIKNLKTEERKSNEKQWNWREFWIGCGLTLTFSFIIFALIRLFKRKR